MVSAAQTPSVRRVELGVRCVLAFLLVIGEHAMLRRSLCATLTALIDPLAVPSGAIAYDLTPCPVFWAEVMWIGLLGLRRDRAGVQGRDPGAKRVQVRHRSRSVIRRDLRGTHCARPARRRPRDNARARSCGVTIGSLAATSIVIVPSPLGNGCAESVRPPRYQLSPRNSSGSVMNECPPLRSLRAPGIN
jgi:hypothetical protein